MTLSLCVVDKLLSNEDGGGIFDDPPAITESVMMPQDHGDDDDDFDALSGQFHERTSAEDAEKKPHCLMLCRSSFGYINYSIVSYLHIISPTYHDMYVQHGVIVCC